MDERKHNYTDWDDGYYGTGPTQPPKSRGGVIAVLLILVIFLCGIIAVLSVLNIKLFQKLRTHEDNALAFSFVADTTSELADQVEPAALSGTGPRTDDASISLRLQASPQGIDNVPAEGALSLQEIYEQNIHCVVSISCTLPSGSASGTGVIFAEQGYIITNAHVVENAVGISVRLTDDRVFQGQIVGRDEISDLAVLRIDADGLTPAQFGDSAALRVGDTVAAIGDPLGSELRGTYTNGIISAINRDVDVNGHTMTLIQTNAALNSGNSGGPLLNCYGQVIGINTMKIGQLRGSSGVEGIGFAIPSATVKDIVDQLVAQGYVSGRPTLGISGETLSIFYQHYYHLPSGLYITDVDRSSDAYRKGLGTGDILISIDDHRITTTDDMKSAIGNCTVGDTVTAVIYRTGQQYRVDLTLSEDKG